MNLQNSTLKGFTQSYTKILKSPKRDIFKYHLSPLLLMIIGLVGTMGSGKTEIAEYLKRKGFEHYTYSNILIEIALKTGIEPTRENLQKLGTEIKQKEHNKGILSKKNN